MEYDFYKKKLNGLKLKILNIFSKEENIERIEIQFKCLNNATFEQKIK